VILLKLGVAVGIVAAAAVVFVVVAVRPYRTPSASMEPTLRVGDKFVIVKWVPWGRGDLVVFRSPGRAAERCGEAGTFVKRVIGLGGDRVVERRGVVSVDGARLSEPYVRRDAESGSWRVPKGSIFLLGDNRAESCDSRAFGAVPRGNVIGKLVLVYWPPKRLGFR
jgi:signal peptidase I